MKPLMVFILHSSSFILEEGRDNAASPTFGKTSNVGRIVPPLHVNIEPTLEPARRRCYNYPHEPRCPPTRPARLSGPQLARLS